MLTGGLQGSGSNIHIIHSARANHSSIWAMHIAISRGRGHDNLFPSSRVTALAFFDDGVPRASHRAICSACRRQFCCYTTRETKRGCPPSVS